MSTQQKIGICDVSFSDSFHRICVCISTYSLFAIWAATTRHLHHMAPCGICITLGGVVDGNDSVCSVVMNRDGGCFTVCAELYGKIPHFSAFL